MNPQLMARQKYAATSLTVQTGRRSEYDVIAHVTQRLRKTAQNAKTDFAAYAAALNDNRRLWNALAVDVADAENQLPDELRARVFYLAEFTNQYTSKILGQKASVMPLLEINVAIMRGLKSEASFQ
ncbi:MAG: flagellar biosynthesis regulator FlaF [Pseudomonadota bacterium]